MQLSYKNYCFIDFEADQVYSEVAKPLEFSFILITEYNIINIQKFKITYPKTWFNDCTEEEKKGLAFNNINCQDDLYQHNKFSISIQEALKIFCNAIFNNFKKEQFVLVGFNNLTYDNIILQRYLDIYYPEHIYQILAKNLDIFRFIKSMSCDNRLDLDLRLDFFKSYENRLFTDYKQLTIYRCLFGYEFIAHDSLEDVKALYKIFKFYSQKFPTLLNRYLRETKTTSYATITQFKNANEVIS